MEVERVNLRDETPGGKTEDVDDWGGCVLVVADTVARSSLSRTSTHPEKNGRIALCHTPVRSSYCGRREGSLHISVQPFSGALNLLPFL